MKSTWQWVALGLGVTVLVSARVSSFQEAFQLDGIIVLPILALVIGQVAGVMIFSVLISEIAVLLEELRNMLGSFSGQNLV